MSNSIVAIGKSPDAIIKMPSRASLEARIKRESVVPITLEELKKNPRRIYAYLFYPSVIRSIVDALVEHGDVTIPLAETFFEDNLRLTCDLTIKGRHYFIV